MAADKRAACEDTGCKSGGRAAGGAALTATDTSAGDCEPAATDAAGTVSHVALPCARVEGAAVAASVSGVGELIMECQLARRACEEVMRQREMKGEERWVDNLLGVCVWAWSAQRVEAGK